MSYDQAVGKIFSKLWKIVASDDFFRYYIYKIGRVYQEKINKHLITR